MHDEEGGTSTLAMLTEGNANALSAAALEQLELEMAEGKEAADLLARLAGGADGTAAEGTAAASCAAASTGGTSPTRCASCASRS